MRDRTNRRLRHVSSAEHLWQDSRLLPRLSCYALGLCPFPTIMLLISKPVDVLGKVMTLGIDGRQESLFKSGIFYNYEDQVYLQPKFFSLQFISPAYRFETELFGLFVTTYKKDCLNLSRDGQSLAGRRQGVRLVLATILPGHVLAAQARFRLELYARKYVILSIDYKIRQALSRSSVAREELQGLVRIYNAIGQARVA